MEIKIGKCKRCGREGYIIPSNNPLLDDDICLDCINNSIDCENLDHFAFFVRTYNLPIDINLYISCLRRDKNKAIKFYIEQLYDDGKLSYSDSATDNWKEIQKEWEKVKTHGQLLEKVKAIKDDFIIRCQEKWGMEYSYEEYIKLDNQYFSIIKGLNMTNPTQIDTVKKYCKMSILVDQLIAGGEIKAIGDATNALTKLADLAQIKELSETASEGTIKTVADLYKYMEDHGFRFNYYDNVPRDIVDRTIKDIQQSIRNEIVNATGLDVTLEQIKENYFREQEEEEENEAQRQITIQQIIEAEDNIGEDEAILDQQLSKEEIIFEDEE